MCLLSPLLLDLSRNTLLPKFRPIFAIWNHFGIYISFNYSPQKQYSENKLGLRGLLEILNIPNITPPTAVIHVPPCLFFCLYDLCIPWWPVSIGREDIP